MSFIKIKSQIFASINLIEIKFLLSLIIGLVFYGIATLNIAFWILISILVPFLLLIIHLLFKPIFTSEFNGIFSSIKEERNLIFVKNVTFISQNTLIIIAYYFMNNEYFSLIIVWAFRLNVIEVILDLIKKKEYLLCIPSIFLALNDFNIAKDSTYIILISNDCSLFIIEYTIWFIAWVVTCLPGRFLTSVHTIYPLFFPPSLWFSVRTLTGMVTLIYLYIPSIFNNITSSEKYKSDIISFSKIYKPIYLIVWASLYLYKFRN